MKIKQFNSVQIAILMSILTIGSKFLGFIREMVLAGFFGTSYIVDVYVMAFTILSVIFGGVITSVSIAYMPLYSRIKERDGIRAGDIFTAQIVNLLLVISIIIAIIGIVFSDTIIAVCAKGFVGESARLGSFYIKVLFSYIIFSSVAAIFESYLQYRGIFLPQILSGYFVSLAIIAGIILSAYTNHYYLAFGTVIGYALRGITIFIIAKINGYKHYRSINLGKHTKELVTLALPVFIGSYITYINLFIDKTLASQLKEGSIAALNYASLLNNMVIGITITILATLVYPKLTKANSLGEYERFNSLVSTGINLVTLIGVPFMLGAILYSNEVVQIVYERGAFDVNATSITGSAFRYYAIGLLFIALNEFIIKIYYSIHDMKSPMMCGLISVAINICLNLILVRYMAHNGLALATSIAAICNTFLLIVQMKKTNPSVRLVESKIKVLKITLIAIISIGISFLSYSIIINNFSDYIYMSMIQLLIAIIVAAISYVVLLKCAKVEEVDIIGKILKLRSK